MLQTSTGVKKSIHDLAIMGGSALFTRELHVGCPHIGDRDRFLARVNDILDRRRLTNNDRYVTEFEKKLSVLSQVKHCVAVCNATAGLELTIRALGLTGEVIVPSMTFVATAHALQWLGIKPVFCDIDPETLCIDPRTIDTLVTTHTTGILAVHLFGRMCDTEALQKIADKHRLRLVFDAAHAIGCVKNGRPVGSFGSAEIFSFHATKILNSFEGGAVMTNDDQLAEKLRLMRNFGFQGMDTVVSIGINAKMSEISAAMGLTSLESFPAFVEVNARNHRLYEALLRDTPGITIDRYDDQDTSNFQYVVMRVDEKLTGFSRDELLAIVRAENVLARRYFYPGCHAMQPYNAAPHVAAPLLPVTEQLNRQLMQLPSGETIGPDDIEKICALIQFCIENSDSIKKQVREKSRVG